MVRHNNVIPNQHFRKNWAVRAHAETLAWLLARGRRLSCAARCATGLRHRWPAAHLVQPAGAQAASPRGCVAVAAGACPANPNPDARPAGCAARLAAAARVAKAKAVFPRPTAGALRPAVHSMTQRYNTKIRAGRGFTLAELKARRRAAAAAGVASADAHASHRAGGGHSRQVRAHHRHRRGPPPQEPLR